MARPVSSHVQEVKQRLMQRLRHGAHQPGDRFLSNRAIADQFHISYQTADRVVRQMVREGLLVRRAAAGTFVPGEASPLVGALLLFDKRAKRKESFGARLLMRLQEALDSLHIDWRLRWIDPESSIKPRLPTDRLPVLWNLAPLLPSLIAGNRRALLLNDRAPSGVAATLLDSVEVDDFSGGACAAQLLLDRTDGERFVIVAGPEDDARSRQRVEGFLSRAPAEVLVTGGWFYEHAGAHAARALAHKPDGIFCCNDRLAHGLIDHARHAGVTCPPIVGFDNAPIAERLGLTTIAIPWSELALAAAQLVRSRLRDHKSTASHRIFAPQPIVRWVQRS